jgi:hypothetical protein
LYYSEIIGINQDSTRRKSKKENEKKSKKKQQKTCIIVLRIPRLEEIQTKCSIKKSSSLIFLSQRAV